MVYVAVQHGRPLAVFESEGVATEYAEAQNGTDATNVFPVIVCPCPYESGARGYAALGGGA